MHKRFEPLASAFYPALLVLIIAIISTALDPYLQYVVGLCFCAMLASTALVPLVGLARIVMLASGAVMGIGAYVSTILIVKSGAPYIFALMLAIFAGMLSGIILGLPAARIQGHHLAMVTLVFQALTIIIIREWTPMTGGAEGMRAPPASIFGYELHSSQSSLLFLACMSAISIFVLAIIVRGRFGKVVRAIASTEIGTEAFGVNLPAYKIAAFAISCTFLSLAGAIMAPQLKIIDPDSFGIVQSIHILAYPIIGGMTSIWGGVIGGGTMRALPEMLRGFAGYAELIFAALAVLVILILPEGLVSGIGRLLGVLRPKAKSVSAGDATPNISIPQWQTLEAVSKRDAASGIPALQIAGVAKKFQSLQAVANVTLEVASGVIHGIIGPNGAGKTTLFNMISGFIAPDAGVIRLFGRSTSNVPARDRVKFGATRTFQHVAIFGELSLLDNVMIGQGDNGVFKTIFGSLKDAVQASDFRQREDLAKSALDVVGLFDRRNERAGSLSLGNQRRLEIARAIVSRPKLLLLDEPVSGVDQADETLLKDLLHKLNQEWSLTMILIEHNIRFVVGCCSVLSVMHQGAIVTEGRPDQVIARDDVQRLYFGKV